MTHLQQKRPACIFYPGFHTFSDIERSVYLDTVSAFGALVATETAEIAAPLGEYLGKEVLGCGVATEVGT